MNNLKNFKTALVIMASMFLASLFITSCEIFEPFVATYCAEHQEIDFCSESYPEDVETFPMYEQAVICEGAGNTTGIEDLDEQDILFTGASGQKAIYHVLLKQGETSTNFTFKYCNSEINDTAVTGYIVNPEFANQIQWQAEIMEKYLIEDDVWEFLLDQKVVPYDGISVPNYAVSSYPNTPVVIRDCEDWGNVGDFKGLFTEI